MKRHEEETKNALSADEIKQVRLVCNTLKEKAIIDVMCSTMCRASELCNLKKEDVDSSLEAVKLYSKKNGYRTAPITPEAIGMLNEYWASRSDNSEYAFVSEDGEHQLTLDELNSIFNDLNKRCNLPIKIHPHIIRHSMALIALSLMKNMKDLNM